jgi:replicative DNA helicase
VGNLGVRFCWAVLRGGEEDWIIDPVSLRAPAIELYEFIVEYQREYGVLPDKSTVLEDVRLEEEFRELAAPEPVAYYTQKIWERSVYQAQKAVAGTQLAEALRLKDVEAISLAATALANVGGEIIFGEKSVDQRTNSAERWARYERLKSAEGGITGLRSPWPSVDDVTRGFNPGKIYSFVARPGAGKSLTLAFLLEWFRRQGRSVGLVSPEMPRETTELRLDAMRFGLPLSDFQSGQLDTLTEERYRAALETPDTGPGIFVAENIWSLVEIEAFVERNKPDALMVDGIYMIEAGHPKQPRHERVEEAVRGLDRIAKRRGRQIPVFLTGQFNRSVKTGSLKTSAEGLAHADAIIQWSTACFAVIQDEAMRMANQIKYRMLKNRDGLMIEVTANWDLETMDPTEITPVEGDRRGSASTDEEGDLLWE